MAGASPRCKSGARMAWPHEVRWSGPVGQRPALRSGARTTWLHDMTPRREGSGPVGGSARAAIPGEDDMAPRREVERLCRAAPAAILFLMTAGRHLPAGTILLPAGHHLAGGRSRAIPEARSPELTQLALPTATRAQLSPTRARTQEATTPVPAPFPSPAVRCFAIGRRATTVAVRHSASAPANGANGSLSKIAQFYRVARKTKNAGNTVANICGIVKHKIRNLRFGCEESIRPIIPPNGSTSRASFPLTLFRRPLPRSCRSPGMQVG